MSGEVIVPNTGELVDLTDLPTTEIAHHLETYDVLLKSIADFKRAATLELADRLDHEGVRTGHVGEFKIEVNAPLEKDWDLEKLGDTLDRFVEQGDLSQAKALRCIELKQSLVWREVKTLLSDPRLAPELSLCFTEVPARRYVRVRRG